MAKTKKKKASKKEEIVINLDNAGVPIAIIISGVLIAAVIFFASRNNAPVLDTAGDPTVPTAEEGIGEEFGEGTVTLGDGAILGDPETATVAIVEFSDYQCGFCKRHADETFPSIKENYIDTGKILYVFKEFPLSTPGQLGYSMAEGGICVFNMSDSETFAQYHKEVFDATSVEDLVTIATGLGVNEQEFRTCLDEGTYRDVVEARATEGRGAGVQGTPGFVVGRIGEDGTVEGTLIAGAYPYETFAEAIEALLEE